jgi:AcrR family transcriptional regulator
MRADARANRARIVDAARELFSERGLDVDVREVCERAGVGMGTLYRNFATKDDLIDAVQEQAVAGLQRLIADGLERREGTGTADLIHSWLAFGEQYGRIGPTLRQRTRARAGGSEPEWVTALRQRGLDAWRGFQAGGLMRDDVPPDFLQEVFDSLLAGYQGMRQRWDAASVSEWLSLILLEGVRPPAKV